MAANEWTHVVMTWDEQMLKVYVNGQPIESGEIRLSGEFTFWEGPLEIGTYPDKPTFLGLIDEFKIYNRALSAEEVKALYDADSTES